MPIPNQAMCNIFIPADTAIDCETIISYIEPIIPCKQCWVGQETNDTYRGEVKGGGCVARFLAYKQINDYGSFDVAGDIFGYTDIDVWNISIDVYSIHGRSPDQVVGQDMSDKFDNNFNSFNPADYIDSYIQG